MLLSEILKLAKITSKGINESYNSSIILKLLDTFNRSSIMLASEYNKTDRARFLFDGLDKDMIRDHYEELIRSGLITQEDYDDPDVRESFFDIKYKKTFSGMEERRRISPIRILMDLLHKHNCNVDLSKLSDSDIDWVSTKDSISKYKYKNGLLFWVDWNNKLRAVTYNNTILMFISYRISWYMNNRDYVGPTDMDAISPDGKYISYIRLGDFIDNAYIEIPHISIITDPEELKNEKLTSLSKLDKVTGMVHTYYVKLSALKKNDMTEKLESRKDYALFLRELYKVTKEMIHKGKEELNKKLSSGLMNVFKDRLKNKKRMDAQLSSVNKVQHILDLTYDNVFQITEDLHNAEIKYLLNISDEAYKLTVSSLEEIRLPKNIIPFFKKSVPNKDLYSKDANVSEEDYDTFWVDSYGDLFVVLNVYVQYIVFRCRELQEKYEEVVDSLKKVTDYNKTANMLNDLSYMYTNYVSLCTGIFGSHTLYTLIANTLLSETGINCEDIFSAFKELV